MQIFKHLFHIVIMCSVTNYRLLVMVERLLFNIFLMLSWNLNNFQVKLTTIHLKKLMSCLISYQLRMILDKIKSFFFLSESRQSCSNSLNSLNPAILGSMIRVVHLRALVHPCVFCLKGTVRPEYKKYLLFVLLWWKFAHTCKIENKMG